MRQRGIPVKTLRSLARFINPIQKWICFAKALLSIESHGGFYTVSPDLLVALVRAFNIQRARMSTGCDLFKGHGYFEFGIFRGFSFWFAEQMAREYAGPDFRLLGFDSFEGLPQPRLASEAAIFTKGDFKGSHEEVTSNLRKWKADFSRIRLYKGFYSRSFFERLRKSEKFPPVSICVIDVDLYESCVHVLDFVKDYLVPGSILIFDDYNQMGEDNNSGERRALGEFKQGNRGFRARHLFNYGWEGVAFEVLSV